ncbi:hypothetical protein [Spirosoma pulveris]
MNYCIQNDVAGIGWPVTSKPASPSDYVDLVKKTYGRATAAVAFATKPQPGHLIWTRSRNGEYYLGRIDDEQGDWRYSDKPLHLDLDIPNQRGCHWIYVGNEANVPGKIVACFRPVNAFQAIRDPEMERYSRWLYANPKGSLEIDTSDNRTIDPTAFFKMISADECEDIVGLYLQKIRGYCLIPSTSKRETIGYEFILHHGETGQTAAVQVKQGSVALDERLKNVADRIFLFSTQGAASVTASNVEVLSIQELYAFLSKHEYLLPKKIRYWLDAMHYKHLT